ncbi:MAG: hypothetical protein AAGK79_13360 [Pseudomonadota bacterium]
MTVTKTPAEVCEGIPLDPNKEVDNAEMRILLDEMRAETAAARDGVNRLASAALYAASNITLSGEQSIDGTTTSVSRVLVGGQTDASENGVYVSASGAWARATDADTDAELANAFVYVTSGTTYGGTAWAIAGTPTVGTDDITLTQVSVTGDVPQDSDDLPEGSTNLYLTSVERAAIANAASADYAFQSITAQSATRNYIRLRDDGGTRKVAFGQLSVRRGGSPVLIGNASDWTEFTLPTDGTTEHYYADLSGSNTIKSTTTRSTALDSATAVYLGSAQFTAFQNATGLEVQDEVNTELAQAQTDITQEATDRAAADTAARALWSSKVFAQASSDAFIQLETVNGERKATFPNLRVEREGGGAEVITGATVTIPSDGTETYFYGDLSDATPAVLSTTTKSTAYSSADIVPLGHGAWGEFTNETGLTVRDHDGLQSDKTINGTVVTEGVVRVAAGTQDLPSAYFDKSAWVIPASAKYQYAFPWDGKVRLGSGATLDVSEMINGTAVDIVAPDGACTIYSKDGWQHANADRELTLPINGAIRVSKIGGNEDKGLVVFEGVGTTTSTATGSVLVHTRSALLAGQSQRVQYFSNSGVCGFVRGLDDLGETPSIHFISGATGSTAIDLRGDGSGTNYWWDAEANAGAGDDGPALTTCLAAVDTATGEGQPTPDFILWAQGEGDFRALESGTYTVASYVDSIKKVFDRILTKCASGAKFYIVPLGSREDETEDKGAAAVREAYLQVIADRSDCFLSAEMYDLPRGSHEVHLTHKGTYILGKREARVFDNEDNSGTNNLGPVLNTATLSNGGKTVTLSFTSSEGLEMPVGVQSATDLHGPTPWGFGVIASGESAAENDPIHVDGVVSGNQVVLNAAVDMTGCKLIYPYGLVPDARLGNFVRDKEWFGDLPGFPLRTFITTLA